MATTCTLTGILYDPTGAVWGNAEVTLRPQPAAVIATTGGTIHAPVTVGPFLSGNDGLLTLPLAPGQYRGTARGAGGAGFTFELAVPDLAAAALRDYIGRQGLTIPTVAQAGTLPVKLVTGTAYAIDQLDAGFGLKTMNAAPVAIALPNNAPPGFSCAILQWGVGPATLVPAVGAALDHPQGLTRTYGQKSLLSLWVHENADGASARWQAAGDMI